MFESLPGILFIHRNTSPQYYGGIERKIISIIDGLRHRGIFRCHLLTNHSESPLCLGCERAGAEIHLSAMSGTSGFLAAVRQTNQVVGKNGIVILQSHMFWGSLVAGLIRRQNSKLRHLMRIHTHIEGSSISTIKRWAYHMADRINSPGVDHYCVLSNRIHQELTHHSGIDESKISVLINGIPNPYKPHVIQSDNAPLPARIAVVGDLQHRKRQDLIIKALGIMKERGIIVQCRFIGLERGEYGEYLRRLCYDLDVVQQVEFKGFQDPVEPLLEGFEVMVLLSDYEGVPTCMMEAMGLNMLAISSDVGGTSDLIHHGQNGFLLEPGNPRDLADRLAIVFSAQSSDLARIRKAGHATFLEKCSLEKMMTALVRIYNQLGVLA